MNRQHTPPSPARAITPTLEVVASPAPSARVGSAASRAADRQRRVLTMTVLATVLVATGMAVNEPPPAVARALATALLAFNVAVTAWPLWCAATDRRVDPAIRHFWRIMGVAMLTLLAGHLCRLHLGDPARRGAADVLDASAAALILLSVATFPSGIHTRSDRLRLLLDVFVTAGAVTTCALTALPSAFHGQFLGSVQPSVVSVVGDALLFATIAMIWLRGMVQERRDPLVPLIVGCGVLAVVQLVSAAARGPWLGTLAELMVGLPCVLIGLAASRHHLRLLQVGVVCGPVRRLSVLPTLSAGALLLLLLVTQLFRGTPPDGALILGTALVGVAALVRQVLGVRTELNSREQTALEQADRRLAALVRHGSDMLTILELDTTVRYASPSHLQVMGIPADLLVGKRMDEQIHRDDLHAAQLGFERLRRGSSASEFLIVRLRDGGGRWRWIEAVGTNLVNEPTVSGLVLNSRDITERKALEAQLLEQALRDPLTGLGNRRLFADRVGHALDRRLRLQSSVALLLLDLDHFKFINDTLGHAKGDALLVAVSERLRTVVRTADTIARLGGDEFAVLLEDIAADDEADATALRIQQALDRPFRLDDREVFVRASIGIAWATDGQDVDALLTDADVAMYGAKNSGRGRVERYSAAMRESVAQRVDLEADLRFALERDELELAYQPVVDLESGRIIAAEALLRWRHPARGMVPPDRFVQVAEESELIIDIGRFVIRRAAMDAAAFRMACPDAATLRVGVNLSARQLLSADLVADVVQALAAAGIGGSAFAVELTETALALNEPVVAGRLQALRDLGLRIALDDFGTGYSSLAYLRRFPIDVLKVDKSFVSYGGECTGNDGVTKAIVSIGASLGMRTVAEGVETMAQLVRLRAIGCALGQGYLFSQAVPGAEFEALLRQWDPSPYAAPTLVA
jgi:diguanylate cyclase (GGDEF)-like protein/PAS domain S-box-containing protein